MTARKRTEPVGFASSTGANESANTPDQGRVTDSEGAILKAHQQYEAIAKSASQSSDARLTTFASSYVESRKTEVSAFCDFLESAENGNLDLVLIGQELQSRQERKSQAPSSFEVASTGFNPGIDLNGAVNCVGLITGFSTSKAIAGV